MSDTVVAAIIGAGVALVGCIVVLIGWVLQPLAQEKVRAWSSRQPKIPKGACLDLLEASESYLDAWTSEVVSAVRGTTKAVAKPRKFDSGSAFTRIQVDAPQEISLLATELVKRTAELSELEEALAVSADAGLDLFLTLAPRVAEARLALFAAIQRGRPARRRFRGR